MVQHLVHIERMIRRTKAENSLCDELQGLRLAVADVMEVGEEERGDGGVGSDGGVDRSETRSLEVRQVILGKGKPSRRSSNQTDLCVCKLLLSS